MFTGITQGIFPITDVHTEKGIITYKIKLSPELLKGLEIGASIAVDGVCQTVAEKKGEAITLNAIDETYRKTTLGNVHVGRLVSIERSVVYGAEIGGHPLSGHIFGTVTLVEKIKKEDNLKLKFQFKEDVKEYIFPKGFIGIDGSSLTINDVDLKHHTLTVNLIPHTLKLTHFADKNVGDFANLELDATTVAIVETVKRYLNNKS